MTVNSNFRDRVVIPVRGQDYSLSIVCLNDGRGMPEVALVTNSDQEYIAGTQTFVRDAEGLMTYISIANNGLKITRDRYDDWDECNLGEL